MSIELPHSPRAAAASPFMAYRLALLARALATETSLRNALRKPVPSSPAPHRAGTPNP